MDVRRKARAFELMNKIFIFTDYYLPGYKSGGAMRTIVNMVDRLGDRFDFRIMTRGYDVYEKETYPGIKVNDWNQIGKAKVYHAGHGGLNFKSIQRVINEAEPDAVYLNSFFSPLAVKYLTLRRMGLTQDLPVVLAPEGEFSPGALRLKATKKRIFRTLAVPGQLYRGLIWKAASAPEADDIRRVVGPDCEIHIAPNMPPSVILENYSFAHKPPKQSGAARFVFLSRVMPKKNIKHTLELLPGVRGDIRLDVYGPIEDEAYWGECLEVIGRLPPNITVEHCGSIDHQEVALKMSDYHFFILPTLGENFGHVMLEAFAAGCPVLISDQTPWRQLAEKKVGWDIPLGEPDNWRAALQACVEADAKEFQALSHNARQYAVDWLAAPEVLEANAYVIERALSLREATVSSAA